MTRPVMAARMATVMTALAVIATPVALAGGASAATPADTVIAADPAPAPPAAPSATPVAATVARVVGIDASIVNGLTVSGAKGATVTLTARGEKPRTLTPKANAVAVFRQLTPGVTYTVAIGGTRVGTGVPVAAVGPAYGLTVSTTGTPDEVLLAWSHKPAKGQGQQVSFDVTATPIAAIGRASDAPAISGTTTATITTMALDPTVKYAFTVTPRNSASAGQASTATMTRTLAEMGAASSVPTTPTPAPAPAPPQAAAPAAAPAPAPAPSPAPAPVPATKTIYICPAEFPENTAGVCEKAAPYTFTTTAYTYHPVNVYGYGQVDWAYSWGHCTGTGKSGNWSNGDPYCQTPVYGDNAVIGIQNVKDATPAGATDTGSAWSTKDPAPVGYADNGTIWVMHTAKIATVVPA